MSVLVVLIIILIVVILAAVIGYALGWYRIEWIEKDIHNSDAKGGREEEDLEAALQQLQDEESLKDKMHLSEYFSEEDAEKDPSVAGEQKNGEDPDSRFVAYDRFGNLEVGRGYLIDCQKTLDRAKDAGEVYAVVYFDFNRFRFLNSLKGVSIGDYILTRLCQELHTVFPAGAKISRISADHFIAVFPMSGDDVFEQSAGALRELSEKLRADVGFKSGLNACMGVTIAKNPRDYEISILLHKANIARHTIKVSRNETWKQYEESMITTWLYGESALEDYSSNQYDEEFVIYYAPQQSLQTLAIVGGEALVRWACEDQLSKMLPSSLSKSKIPTNSSKVLYQVCRAISRWRKAGKKTLPVSVAIPITEFYMEDLDAFLVRCLSEFQLDPSTLAIVLEASMIRLNWSAASQQIAKLRDIGVRVGVDEIDVGYKDLEWISGLPLHFIKLHRSFVASIENDEQAQEALSKQVRRAEQMGIRVVLEGIDRRDQVTSVAALELQNIRLQGVQCGYPVSADEFSHLLPEYVEQAPRAETVIVDKDALPDDVFK